MNFLSITIGPPEDNSTAGGILFLVEAAVDGMTLPEWLDVDEFFRSLAPLPETALAKVTKTKPRPKKVRARLAVAASRTLPIFNCSCGCFGCGGYHVQVTLTGEALVWEGNFVHSAHASGKTPVRYAFSWDNVRYVAGQLITAIVVAARQHPHGAVSSGVTGEDLVEYLTLYQRCLDRLDSAHRT